MKSTQDYLNDIQSKLRGEDQEEVISAAFASLDDRIRKLNEGVESESGSSIRARVLDFEGKPHLILPLELLPSLTTLLQDFFGKMHSRGSFEITEHGNQTMIEGKLCYPLDMLGTLQSFLLYLTQSVRALEERNYRDADDGSTSDPDPES